jgi:hypothetical protein
MKQYIKYLILGLSMVLLPVMDANGKGFSSSRSGGFSSSRSSSSSGFSSSRSSSSSSSKPSKNLHIHGYCHNRPYFDIIKTILKNRHSKIQIHQLKYEIL